MTKRQLGGSWVEIDEPNTRDWYATATGWDCPCGDCQNFLAVARARQLPSSVLALLDSLQIPPEKATYVCQLYSDGDGQHYQCSYRIAGRIIQEETTQEGIAGRATGETTETTERMEDTENAGKPTAETRNQVGWCWHEPYPYGAPGFPVPHFDLAFVLTLPWMLEEPPTRGDPG